MMKRLMLAAAVCLAAAATMPAAAAERKVAAPNGVEVSINGDEFDGKLEFTAPAVNFGQFSFFLVAAVKRTGQPLGPIMIVGSISYNGDWRRYDAATFRGGEKAQGVFADRDVVSCSGSRYSGCALREGFQVTLTDAQVLKYGQDGYLDIKMHAQASNEEPVIRVPISYIAAVKAVAGK